MIKYIKKQRKLPVYLFAILFIFLGKMANAQPQASKQKINVDQIFNIDWQGHQALPYQKNLSLNSSFVAFELLQNNKTAFLTDVNDAIMIYDAQGNLVSSFNLDVKPLGFTHNKKTLYVLTEDAVVLYDETGRKQDNFNIDFPNRGFYGIKAFNDEVYLFDANGTSVPVNSPGNVLQGWLLNDGSFAETILSASQNYLLRWFDEDNDFGFEKEIVGNQKLACAIVLGADEDNIYVDAQYIVNESPLEIDRYIEAISRNNTETKTLFVDKDEVTRIKLPAVYHTYIQRDISVTDSGVLHSISSPAGVHLFKLSNEASDTNSVLKTNRTYPQNLLGVRHHYNNELLQLEADDK